MVKSQDINKIKVIPLTAEEKHCAILLFKDSIEAARDCVKKFYSPEDIQLMQRFIDNYNVLEQK